MIAANKIDAIFTEDDPVQRLKDEFEPQGVKVFPISGVTGQGIKELLYYVSNELQHLDQETIVFEQEYFPEEEIPMNDLPYTVEKEDDMYVVEGRSKRCWDIQIWIPREDLHFSRNSSRIQEFWSSLKKLVSRREIQYECMACSLTITNNSSDAVR